jgi:hypothetical protein
MIVIISLIGIVAFMVFVLPLVPGELFKENRQTANDLRESIGMKKIDLEQIQEKQRQERLIKKWERQSVINLAKFKDIRSGMTYAQAELVIESPGEEQSRTDLAGYNTVIYAWRNDDGSNAILMFQNNKLVSKSQFGLK